MAERSVPGLILSVVATILLLIPLCLWNVKESVVLVLIAFLAVGLCSIIRLLVVLNANGTEIGVINDNKKMVNMLVVAIAAISGLCAFIAFIWLTVDIAEYNSSPYSSFFSYNATFYFGYGCVVASVVASIGNIGLGFLDTRV
ncbi:uncharacterized protein LOC134814145 [Bolinopsis microptera]|uniref:uncharacterized protein LOC134814145 n=1 Tax=Bolinopsis microptera TaxID=2820187 RepID=UPI00307ABD6E